MPLPLPALLAGASLVGSFFDSQQYYPAAEAPSRTGLLGDALGGALGGYLGGKALGGGGGQAAGAGALPGGDILQILTNGGFSGQGVGGQQQQQPAGGLDLNQIIGLLGQQGVAQQGGPTPLGMFNQGGLGGRL